MLIGFMVVLLNFLLDATAAPLLKFGDFVPKSLKRGQLDPKF